RGGPDLQRIPQALPWLRRHGRQEAPRAGGGRSIMNALEGIDPFRETTPELSQTRRCDRARGRAGVSATNERPAELVSSRCRTAAEHGDFQESAASEHFVACRSSGDALSAYPAV